MDWDGEADAVGQTLRLLEGLGLEPDPVPRMDVRELRGGLRCFDLGAGGGVDAALLLSEPVTGLGYSGILFRVDYGVRGSVKGVYPGSVISQTIYESSGLFRKKVTGAGWVIPPEGAPHPYGGRQGAPPRPGEVWGGGPHEALVKALCGDEALEGLVLRLLESLPEPVNLSVYCDGWGESVRVSGDRWVALDELEAFYLNPLYVEVVARVCLHLAEVRRLFGGLTF